MFRNKSEKHIVKKSALQRSIVLDERKRRKNLLDTLIIGSLCFGLSVTFIVLIKYIFTTDYSGLSPVVCGIITLAIYFLLRLSRLGYVNSATLLFLSIVYCISTYTLMRWGVLAPEGLLAYGVLIVLAGILTTSRAAFATTLLCAATLALLLMLDQEGQIIVDNTWLAKPAGYDDILVFALTLLIVAIVSWLSNREIRQSLGRALKSEAMLKHERDKLEDTVRERSRELERLQLRKTIELQKFAEFGRLSSSLLHDLASPLMAASMSIGQIKDDKHLSVLEDAKLSLRQIEMYVKHARAQLHEREKSENFNIKSEIAKIIRSLSISANDEVNVVFGEGVPTILTGDAAQFDRIVANLISNAFDAQKPSPKKVVDIKLMRLRESITLEVVDHGKGIPNDVLPRIFEAFYTTKPQGESMGIGLVIAKNAVEDHFKGTIEVHNSGYAGACFTITIPLNKKL